MAALARGPLRLAARFPGLRALSFRLLQRHLTIVDHYVTVNRPAAAELARELAALPRLTALDLSGAELTGSALADVCCAALALPALRSLALPMGFDASASVGPIGEPELQALEFIRTSGALIGCAGAAVTVDRRGLSLRP